ncbi:MAG: hypothetical protein GY856_22400, partial [bacterium]|nr:hypothetical protein [bacterium]
MALVKDFVEAVEENEGTLTSEDFIEIGELRADPVLQEVVELEVRVVSEVRGVFFELQQDRDRRLRKPRIEKAPVVVGAVGEGE